MVTLDMADITTAILRETKRKSSDQLKLAQFLSVRCAAKTTAMEQA
jgi:hypothetical protein